MEKVLLPSSSQGSELQRTFLSFLSKTKCEAQGVSIENMVQALQQPPGQVEGYVLLSQGFALVSSGAQA